MSIKPLPEALRSSVRSGIILFDLTKVVEELIFNSLDAGATKVSVAVGVGTCYVKVVDNGAGITRDGLVLLGERYATSKFDQLTDIDGATGSFGFRGEALGSISDVSLLEIVTKAHGRPNGYRKVIKGCKCLYLGIDDDRQDVGTTVIVRNLFYNQPVRRNHLQSSPKKVLHSVKECVLRIALVHLTVSFKVINVESEDELLCTYPSASPLPLLRSGFGIEVSSSLHEIDVSNSDLKLSGYISGPCEIFSVKAFQYFYINSRFICKCPVHKLLNQLAARINGSDLLKANVSRNGKRIRSQTYPAYILNLSCPRSQYDLTFDPSKTSVEFKDWDPILAFIGKAVQRFWSQNASSGNLLGSPADILGKNDTRKEEDYNILSLEEDYGISRKKFRTHHHQASLDLPSPQLKMLPEESMHMSACRDGIFSRQKSCRSALEVEENQTELGFACQTDYSFDPFKATVNIENDNHLWASDSNVTVAEDQFLENALTIETPNEHVACTLGSRWEDTDLEVDANMSYGLKVSGLAADCFETGHSVEEVTGYHNKFSMQSCSSRRSLQSDGALSASDKDFEFQIDGFRTKRKWPDHDYRADIGEVYNDNQSIEPWQNKAAITWSMGSKLLARNAKKSLSNVGDYFAKASDIPTYSVKQIRKFGPTNRSSSSELSPFSPVSLFSTKLEGIQNFIHEDVLEGGFKYDRGVEYDYFADTKVKDCSNLEDYTDCKVDIFDFHRHNRNDILFPKRSDKTDWFGIDLCGKDYDNTRAAPLHYISSFSYVGEDKNQTAQIRYQDRIYDSAKRPRRSHSAPPFYRGKKKFFGLTNCATSQETSNLKEGPKSFGEYHPSPKPSYVNNSLYCASPGLKTARDNNEIQNCEKPVEGQSLCNMSSEDFTSMENEEPSASGIKWRKSCPQGTTGDKSHNQDSSILDISSGILNLAAGDSLVPKSISKNCLEDAKVLPQIDRKFIPVVAGGVLAIIDQHAADERIRLEELRQKVLSGEMKKITYLDAEQELILPEMGYQLLQNYAEQVQNWGWICTIHSQRSRSFKRNLNLLHKKPSVATLVAVPCILGVSLTDADLLEFLQQLSDTDGSSAIPPSVLRILNSKACRGAIMFGDKLLPSECSLIVEELKQTSLCFQCAHGRPTTAPLVNMEMLHNQIAKLGSWSGASNESWHGLHRHELSLERAAQRLRSAGGQC
ncbi:hypothetical protein LguiB_032907 [Lonicera macranthoides]